MKNKEIKFYKNKVALNVLALNLKNAQDIIEVTEGNVVVGILSNKFETIDLAKSEIAKWKEYLNNKISIGLGDGNPKQSYIVAKLSKIILPAHTNQVFTGVGLSIKNYEDNPVFVNCLCSPTGKPGYVKISTGPLSSEENGGIVEINSAIAMAKDMGASSIKFFPMNGLSTSKELHAIAKACAKQDFGLEPTGGITVENFEEILQIILDAGVKKIIPHVYNSIIDKDGYTRIDQLEKIYKIIKKIVN